MDTTKVMIDCIAGVGWKYHLGWVEDIKDLMMEYGL